MSWLDPNFKYCPAHTHADSASFAHRQRLRALAAATQREIAPDDRESLLRDYERRMRQAVWRAK